jgi:hypothetical protein
MLCRRERIENGIGVNEQHMLVVVVGQGVINLEILWSSRKIISPTGNYGLC